MHIALPHLVRMSFLFGEPAAFQNITTCRPEWAVNARANPLSEFIRNTNALALVEGVVLPSSSTPGDFFDIAGNVQDEKHILRAVDSRQVPGPARMSACVVSVRVAPAIFQSQLHCESSIMIACIHA